MAEAQPKAKISDIKKAVSIAGETLKEFSPEWTNLPEKDKADLRQGVTDGTLTY